MKPLTMLLILLLLTVAARAQETPARTWAGFGFSVTKSTAQDSGAAIAGADVRLAYDLRHGFQARGEAEYRNRPTIKHLLIGEDAVDVTSEFRYGGALIYHFPTEWRMRPMVGGGVLVTRQFFDFNQPPYPPGYAVYNSAVNPNFTIGASLGRRSEIAFTKYLSDTYGYSNLRGWGVDYLRTRKVSDGMRLRSGVRFKRWTFYEGDERYDERAVEVSGFIGFHFQ